jgi:hypothetical protein
MAAGVAIVALAAPASAMPAGGFGLGRVAAAPGAGRVEKVEFRRRPDGTMFYRRPRFDGKGPYLFYYRGYAYPYYPGYAYRAARGELKPYDRPHRLRVVD